MCKAFSCVVTEDCHAKWKKDVEIMNAQAALEAAKKETAWWQGVLTRLAEGEQIPGVEEKMREGER